MVKVDLSGTKASAASLALGDPLQVGQTAVAIGSPFGLDQTVTSGIVSAVDRAMQTTNGAIDMVQTDAPINPGNSGGPLADLQGRVIGINDQIESCVREQQRCRLRHPDRHREGRRRQDRRGRAGDVRVPRCADAGLGSGCGRRPVR